ncbi:MAG TPA: CotH kinase family protein, partial [Solirubrobacterales bacterium]|nr:CotH kinase family protein [Solirubrobacterales bacterium]
QDRSMAHEALAYLAFGAVDAPASRSGYAYLRLNGEDVGLYADVETLDKVAIEKRFGTFEEPPQHVYEGESGDDLLPGKAGSFEVDEGDDGDLSDLEALVEAVNGSGEDPWSQRVSPFADLDEMARMWAVERYIAHWDGYAGHAQPGERPNNYYLYSDAGGRFQMLPWGTDQTWDLNLEIPHRIVSFDSEGGVMFDQCLADEACFRAYWEALGEVTDAVEAMEAGPFLTAAAAMLAPWQQREREFGRAESTEAEVTAAVSETAAFIADRPEEAREWLEANEPPPLPQPEEEEPKTPPTEPAPPTLTPPIDLPPQQPVRFGRVARQGSVLSIRLGFAGGGKVRVRATMGIDSRRLTACAASAEVAERGRKTIPCPLTKAALARLAKSATPLQLQATFTAQSGERKAIKRQIRLAAL